MTNLTEAQKQALETVLDITLEEADQCRGWASQRREIINKKLKSQALATAEAIEQATLKRVGKYLSHLVYELPIMHGDYQFDIISTNKFIESLKQGKLEE